MSLAFVFPGQGSQSIGMMSALARVSPVIEATFAEASGGVGLRSVAALPGRTRAKLLNSTECTQPAMLTAGVATYRLWRERGGAQPAMMAGHSLGEFTRAGGRRYLGFQDRGGSGEIPRRTDAGRGAAAARAAWPRFSGSRTSMSKRPASEAAQGEVVEAVNFNAPGQVVIAGTAAAVARAIEIATAKGARRALALPISVPAHSSLMQPAAEQLRVRLESTAFAPAAGIAVYGVDVKIHTQRRRDSRRAGQTAVHAGVLGGDGAHDDRGRAPPRSWNADRARY